MVCGGGVKNRQLVTRQKQASNHGCSEAEGVKTFELIYPKKSS